VYDISRSAVAILGAYLLAGMSAVAMAATGMLSFVGPLFLSTHTGRLADNAGGIAEMSFLDDEVRQTYGYARCCGHTTAAIGKGICDWICCAGGAFQWMTSYL